MSTATLTDNPMQPYTKEELLQMAETGKKQIADGYFFTTEEVISILCLTDMSSLEAGIWYSKGKTAIFQVCT